MLGSSWNEDLGGRRRNERARKSVPHIEENRDRKVVMKSLRLLSDVVTMIQQKYKNEVRL